jgi:regulator of Ty1 transposition protein 103
MASPRGVQAQLARRLQSLNNTAECIKSTTHLFYNLHAKDGVRMWLNEMRVASLDRRLPFMYVANDVMQHRHLARQNYVNEFAKVIELAVQLIAQHSVTNQKTTRMLKVGNKRRMTHPCVFLLRVS